VTLPDVQQTKPTIKRYIHQVGVENIQVPFLLESRSGGFHETIARVSIRTDLSEDQKGVSMSRFHLTLHKYLDKPLKKVLIKDLLDDIRKSQNTGKSYICFKFKIPMMRTSLKSNHIDFPIYYDCKFEGQLEEIIYDGSSKIGAEIPSIFKFYQGVTIQYASYCPCSAELSKDLLNKNSNGFPHAQRSFAKVLVENNSDQYVWLEDIIETVENSIKTLPYPIVKRVDEQEIARIAADNPIFVEDAIRQIANALDEKEYYDWIVKCIHEESIHTSEAISMMWKGVPNGFDSTYYL